MKYYSEITKQLYDSQDELYKAEHADEIKKAEEKKKSEERARRAKEVEDAISAADAAHKAAQEKLNAFIKDYGAFHTSIKEVGKNAGSAIGDFLEWFDSYLGL